MSQFIRFLFAGAALVLTALPNTASACAACFGRSDSPLAKGMNMGILSLLVVVVLVLSGFAAFFIFLVKRSSLTPMPTGVSEEQTPKPLSNLSS